MLRGEAGYYFDAEEFDEIALEYENSGSVDDALSAVENGLRFHPGSDLLLAKKACYLLMLEREDEARDTVSLVHVDNEESHSVKLELFLKDFKYEEGMRELRSWMWMPDISPERCLDVLDLCIDFDFVGEALPVILKHAERIPVAQRKALYNEMVETLDESACAKYRYMVYEKILDLEPFSKNHWKGATFAYLDAGNYVKAIEAADFAIAVSPEDPDALYNKAYCHYVAGDYAKALQLLSKNMSRFEDKSSLYEIMAECYTGIGKYSASDCVLDVAQKLYPDNARYLYIRAKNSYLSDKPDLQASVEFLKKALRLSPEDVSVSLLLAEVYNEMERYSDARAILGRLIDLNVAEAKVYTLLGDVEIKSGFPDIAIGYYRKVLDFERYNVDVYFKLIYAYSEVEDVDNMKRVIDNLESLIDSASDDMDGIDDELAKGVKNIRKAIEHIKTILRNSIDDKI